MSITWSNLTIDFILIQIIRLRNSKLVASKKLKFYNRKSWTLINIWILRGKNEYLEKN